MRNHKVEDPFIVSFISAIFSGLVFSLYMYLVISQQTPKFIATFSYTVFYYLLVGFISHLGLLFWYHFPRKKVFQFLTSKYLKAPLALLAIVYLVYDFDEHEWYIPAWIIAWIGSMIAVEHMRLGAIKLWERMRS